MTSIPKEDERTPGLDDLPDAIDFLSEINAHPGAWCFIYEGEDGDSWTQGSTAPDQAAASVSSLREALQICDGLIGCQIREGVINSIDELKIIQRTVRAALSGVTQPASPWTPEMKWAAMDIDQAVCDLVETMREIEKQCVQADDPEHHTLSLVKHMARNALKRLSQPSTEVEKISTDEVPG